jgi:hypothetical protein
MRFPVFVRIAAIFVPLTLAGGTGSADAAQASPAKPRSVIMVWDTGRPTAEALTPAVLEGKNDWLPIPVGETTDSLKGDAVLSNDRIVAVLRKQGSAVEVHAVKYSGTAARLQLRLMTAAGEPAARLKRMAIIENTRGARAWKRLSRPRKMPRSPASYASSGAMYRSRRSRAPGRASFSRTTGRVYSRTGTLRKNEWPIRLTFIHSL